MAGNKILESHNLLAYKGIWRTSTSYAVGDIVTQSGYQVYCQVAHTSSTFATDVTAGNWKMASPMKNFILNSAMEISQRNTTFTSPSNGSYLLDRYVYINASTATHTVTQDTDVPTFAQANYNFKNSMRLNLTAADTSIAAGDIVNFGQRIEGNNIIPLIGKTFTVQFWVKATLPGTYSFVAGGGGSNRYFLKEYTINAVDTWEKKVLTFDAIPTGGLFATDNTEGFFVRWTLASGSTYYGTVGSWQTGNLIASPNQINGINTGATNFRITGFMLNEGPAPADFQTAGANIQAELAMCQRYYQRIGTSTTNSVQHFAYASTAPQNVYMRLALFAPMRTVPTVTIAGTWTMTNATTTAPLSTSPGADGITLYATSSGAGQVGWNNATPSTQYVEVSAEL